MLFQSPEGREREEEEDGCQKVKGGGGKRAAKWRGGEKRSKQEEVRIVTKAGSPSFSPAGVATRRRQTHSQTEIGFRPRPSPSVCLYG